MNMPYRPVSNYAAVDMIVDMIVKIFDGAFIEKLVSGR